MGCACASGHDCGCHHQGMYPGGGRYASPSTLGIRRRLRGLGAIDPSTAAAQVIGSDSKVTAAIKSVIVASAGTLQLVDTNGQPAYIPGTTECAAAQGIATGAQTDLKIAQTSTGLALTGVQLASSAGILAAPATMGISIAVSAIVGLFSTLVQHHAQAVKTEQTALCAAVPAANNYLNVIAQAVSGGLATPQDGIAALESLKGDFRSAVGSIYNDCNAACVMNMELDAIILVMESQFQDMINAASAASTPAAAAPATVITAGGANVSSPGGVVAPASSYSSFYSTATPTVTPNTVAAPTSSVPAFTTATPAAAAAPATSTDWLPIAAMVIGGFFLLRSL
jgi:hypothetical protein